MLNFMTRLVSLLGGKSEVEVERVARERAKRGCARTLQTALFELAGIL